MPYIETDKMVSNMVRSVRSQCTRICMVFCPRQKFRGTCIYVKVYKYSMGFRYLLWTNQIAVFVMAEFVFNNMVEGVTQKR